MKQFLQRMVESYYSSSCDRSYDWAGQCVATRHPESLLDIGCGDGSRLQRYLNEKPRIYKGIEGSAVLAARAGKNGIDVSKADLNSGWPFEDTSFDTIHASQVIEHVHNTRLFLSEGLRCLKPGGELIMTSENLCSLLNLSAMILGYTPFSLINACGWYSGNPLGLHAGEAFSEHAQLELPPLDDPAFSGVSGHNRVLSVSQAREMLEKTGFVDIDVRSIGLMPLSEWMGRPLEKIMPRRGHWLLMRGRKATTS